LGEIGTIEFGIDEKGDYVPIVKDDWYTEDEYNAYLRRQPKLSNEAGYDDGTPFFSAMMEVLGEFDEKKYDGKSLNDLIRDLL